MNKTIKNISTKSLVAIRNRSYKAGCTATSVIRVKQGLEVPLWMIRDEIKTRTDRGEVITRTSLRSNLKWNRAGSQLEKNKITPELYYEKARARFMNPNIPDEELDLAEGWNVRDIPPNTTASYYIPPEVNGRFMKKLFVKGVGTQYEVILFITFWFWKSEKYAMGDTVFVYERLFTKPITEMVLMDQIPINGSNLFQHNGAPLFNLSSQSEYLIRELCIGTNIRYSSLNGPHPDK